MKRFFLAGVLGALLCALPLMANAVPKPDAKKILVVTRNNFLTLTLRQYGGSPVVNTTLAVAQNSMSYEDNSTSDKLTGNATLTNNQVAALVNKLNDAQLVAIDSWRLNVKGAVPKKVVQTLILQMSDSQNKDRTFTIRAPEDRLKLQKFSAFLKYLSVLQTQKITSVNSSKPPRPYNPTDYITRAKLDLLKLEISGGFTGRESAFVITTDDLRGGGRIKEKILPTDANDNATEKYTNFSEDELQRILFLLNAADLPLLNGKNFKQKNLADGFNEVLTVKLKDGRTFTVSNYGDAAPPEYSAIIHFLNELKNSNLTPTQ